MKKFDEKVLSSPQSVLHCLPVTPAALLLILATLLTIISCEYKRPEIIYAEPASTPLTNSFTSLDDLAQAFLTAIADSSTEDMYKLCVTEDEYKNIIWRRLSEHKQQMIPLDDAWEWVVRDNDKVVRRWLQDYGKMKFRLIDFHPEGRTFKEDSMTVFQTLMTVEDEYGDTYDWKVMNRVVNINDTYKVIVYND